MTPDDFRVQILADMAAYWNAERAWWLGNRKVGR